MTRLYSAATANRAMRALLSIGLLLLVVVVTSGCAGGPSPAPTPDPFSGLADRSDQSFREGLEAYGRGKYRDALTAFERARILSPSSDERIDQMIERSKAAMAPTPTPVPPTPTSVPVTPTATPVAMSSQTPDAELGRRYFGQVSLSAVPGAESEAPAASKFFYQDQIGLQVPGLKQYLRLPFTLRVFNLESGRMIAERSSEDSPSVVSAVATQVSKRAAPPTTDPMASLKVDARGQVIVPTSEPAPAAADDNKLARFWTTYVWYHKGGEDPGRYRVELYANGILTHRFDYTVVTEPVPVVEVAKSEPPLVPTATAKLDPVPPPVDNKPAPVVNKPVTSAPAPVAAAPAPTLEPTPIPTATPVPTPATANATTIGGLPAGLDVNAYDGRVFIADGSGVIWTTDPQRPTRLNRPVTVDRLPVDLAIDQTTGNVFVSARNEPAMLVLDSSGRRLSTIPMPVTPGDVQIDSGLGLAFVVLPERQALGVIDTRAARMLRTIPNLPQVTSLSLDPERHQLYATHLAGQLTIIDAPSNQVTGRVSVTGVGLSSVATSRGLVYAVNTASHELAVVEPVSQGVIRYLLNEEPAAVAASEETGSVYVLASRPNTVLRIDPSTGSELGRVTLPDRSGRFGTVNSQAQFNGLRARMVLNRTNESLYLTLPEAGSLSIVPHEQFPLMTQAIPWVEVPDAPVMAATIPGVIRPGAPPLPDQPAPLRAQAPSEISEDAN